MGKPAAPKEAVTAAADLLYREVPAARAELENWRKGLAPWDGIVPVVKRWIRFVLQGHETVKADTRAVLQNFANLYGVQTRKGAYGDEPLSVEMHLRFTASQWAAIQKAAESVRATPANFIRMASVSEAYRMSDSGQKESAA